jgi:hypothetical protein
MSFVPDLSGEYPENALAPQAFGRVASQKSNHKSMDHRRRTK